MHQNRFILYLLKQEQPLLLEDLVQQEKRELERQAASVMPNEMAANVEANNQGLLSDQDFERLRADVLSSAPQGITNQGMLPMQQQQQQPQSQQPMQQMQGQPSNTNQFVQHVGNNRQQFAPRGVGQPQWRAPIHQQQQQQQQPPQQQMNVNVGPIINVATPNEPTYVKKEG